MKTVLITEPVARTGLDLLSARDDIAWRYADGPLENEVADADAIIVRTAPLSADLLDGAERLQIVSKHGVGCDNIAVDRLTARGIAVTIAAGANTQSVVEHTMALMLACSRRIGELGAAIRAGDFGARDSIVARDLRDARALILGFGRVGQGLAPLLNAFGMDVTVAAPHVDQAMANRLGVTLASDLKETLSWADIVTLHLPLTPDSRNILGHAEFAAMKTGTILINTSRGGLVDEDALLWALEKGPLSAAGLDVYAQEPVPASHPLLSRKDVVATPHTAATSNGASDAMSLMAAQNVLDGLDGKLDPDRLFNPVIQTD